MTRRQQESAHAEKIDLQGNFYARISRHAQESLAVRARAAGITPAAWGRRALYRALGLTPAGEPR